MVADLEKLAAAWHRAITVDKLGATLAARHTGVSVILKAVPRGRDYGDVVRWRA